MEKKKLDTKIIGLYTAFLGGILIHAFGLINIIHNHDDLAVYKWGYGTGIESGRWFLTVIGDFINECGFGHNLPWFCGIIFIMFLSISTYFLVDIFNIKKKSHAVLIALAFVSFPTAAATMIYRFTTIYYGFAIALAVFAAFVAIKMNHKLVAFIISSISLACSAGIYQAYVPLTIAIFVSYLLFIMLNENKSVKEIIKKGIYYCGCILGGMGIYFITLKILLIYYNTSLGSYQGIDSMGQVGLKEIPILILKSIKQFLLMPINNVCDLAGLNIVKNAYIFLGIVTIVGMVLILAKKRLKIIEAILFIVLCVAFPISVGFIYVMVPNEQDDGIYTLMVYSFVMILVISIIISEVISKIEIQSVIKKSICYFNILLVSVIICSYFYTDNVNYKVGYYVNMHLENYATSMITQIRMTDGYKSYMPWAFIGRINDSNLTNMFGEELLYQGVCTEQRILNSYAWKSIFTAYAGYNYKEVSEEKLEDIINNEEVKAMPVWPDEGSIKIIDDVVVIKCIELKD